MPPVSRWWFQICFIFTPILGEMIQFDEHIFQRVGSTTNQIFTYIWNRDDMKGGISDPKLGHVHRWEVGPEKFSAPGKRLNLCEASQGIPLTSSIAPLMSSRRSCRFAPGETKRMVGDRRMLKGYAKGCSHVAYFCSLWNEDGVVKELRIFSKNHWGTTSSKPPWLCSMLIFRGVVYMDWLPVERE